MSIFIQNLMDVRSSAMCETCVVGQRANQFARKHMENTGPEDCTKMTPACATKVKRKYMHFKIFLGDRAKTPSFSLIAGGGAPPPLVLKVPCLAPLGSCWLPHNSPEMNYRVHPNTTNYHLIQLIYH